MRVNIVVGSADMPWIGGRFAKELVARLPQYDVEAVINGSGAFDLEYQQIVYGDPDTRPAVGMFTHGHTRPHKYATSYDGQIALNTATLAQLKDGGATAPALIEMPVGGQFRTAKPLVFGVAGRTYKDGRKGEHLVQAMVEAGYEVIAWGPGPWPCRIVSDQLAALPSFYGSIDYYVDASYDEGGCVPALEAAAMGKPVIGHGYGGLMPVIVYERGDVASLLEVLRRLTTPRTYDDWAREHAAYFQSVLKRLQVAA